MSLNRDIHARACTRRASTNRWKKFVGNLHSMHLLATVRDRNCTRKRSGRLEGVRRDNAKEEKERRRTRKWERCMFFRRKWTRNDASEEDSNKEREKEKGGRSRQEERVCLRREENPRGGRNLASSISLSLPFFSSYSKRENGRSERVNTRAGDGCCCCGRGITSAPLTRKTFRLNLVLDSARLLSTHPNRPASLARPKRSVNPPCLLPPPPLFSHTLQVLPNRCWTTTGTRYRVSDSISKLST